MSVECAVFDMDGTIVDNMRYHVQAWLEVSRALGLDVRPEVFERDLAGKKNDEIVPFILGRPVSREELDRISRAKEERYRELYAPHVAPMPGLPELVERLHAARERCAIATAAPRENREFLLSRLGVRFDAVAGAEHAARGKPAPDIYLAAARALGVAPGRCVAFEDAPNGVAAARAAGMEVAAVLTTSPPEVLQAAGARWLLRDYTELPADLEELLFSP